MNLLLFRLDTESVKKNSSQVPFPGKKEDEASGTNLPKEAKRSKSAPGTANQSVNN